MEGEGQSGSSSDEDEASAIAEVRFVPDDSQARTWKIKQCIIVYSFLKASKVYLKFIDFPLVDRMYEAMSECQALHPDSEQSDGKFCSDVTKS